MWTLAESSHLWKHISARQNALGYCFDDAFVIHVTLVNYLWASSFAPRIQCQGWPPVKQAQLALAALTAGNMDMLDLVDGQIRVRNHQVTSISRVKSPSRHFPALSPGLRAHFHAWTTSRAGQDALNKWFMESSVRLLQSVSQIPVSCARSDPTWALFDRLLHVPDLFPLENYWDLMLNASHAVLENPHAAQMIRDLHTYRSVHIVSLAGSWWRESHNRRPAWTAREDWLLDIVAALRETNHPDDLAKHNAYNICRCIVAKLAMWAAWHGYAATLRALHQLHRPAAHMWISVTQVVVHRGHLECLQFIFQHNLGKCVPDQWFKPNVFGDNTGAEFIDSLKIASMQHHLNCVEWLLEFATTLDGYSPERMQVIRDHLRAKGVEVPFGAQPGDTHESTDGEEAWRGEKGT